MTDASPAADQALQALNRHFLRALLALGETGNAQRDQACRIAAAAWSELRHAHPREAERLNGVLHALTQSTHPSTTVQGDTHVTGTAQG
ncbi:MAG: hypothetical protein KGL98_09790 [Gammaproteobacteria bacterium]|nr:hypothetical protein [Gammaproteobacteria bacterium]MBU6508923.1 hypothetical protein [Gammaproteobacteria bacterium]MDE1983353.1 hypothetical protein [Gammaproteobacteria bacterium]MDE2108105.1 hypothetical protein [Gammaproteobacteria bacterium]MDE2461529.1 hypothetical protein [Gammaproteobacteria bacterium]